MGVWEKYQEVVLYRLGVIDVQLRSIHKDLETLHEDVAKLKVKAGLWGLLGGIIPVVFVLLMSSCSLFAMKQPDAAPRSVVGESLDSVVAFVREDSFRPYCGGVVHRGIIISANHCFDDDTGILFVLRSDEHEVLTGHILRRDWVQDLAFVRADDSQLWEGRPLSPDLPEYGDQVILIGHPRGLSWSVATGIVSHPRRVGGSHADTVWMQVSAPVTYGNSGGPSLNSYGEITGIVSFFSTDHHLGGVSHLSEIRRHTGEIFE